MRSLWPRWIKGLRSPVVMAAPRHPQQMRRAFRLRNLIPGLLGIVCTLALLQLGWGMASRGSLHRLLFHLRGPQPWDERVVLVKIDQESLDQLGWFPWSRDRYIALLDQLSLSNNNVVVFDIIFSEPTVFDSSLADAMERHGQVVLSRALNRGRKVWEPSPKLADAASALGDISHFPLTEHLAYEPVPLQVQGFPSLALVAVQVYGLSQVIPQIPHASQSLRLNWPSPVEQFTQYSFAEILTGSVPPEALSDKIILVGVTAEGFDSLNTPFNSQGNANGIHFHGALIHTLLQDSDLRPLTWEVQLLLALLLGPIWGAGLARLSMPWQVVVTGAGLWVWLLLASMALAGGNWLFPMSWPCTLLVSTTLGAMVMGNCQLQRIKMALLRQATVDSVTQIHNRAYFDQQLLTQWQLASRSQRPLSLLLCDIDFFKAYNDTYGHPAGDRCLHEVAQILKAALPRPVDWVARYGGEEFVVVLPQTDLEGGILVAERIQSQLQQHNVPHRSSQAAPYITLSLGLSSMVPNPQVSYQRLIDDADRALYLAKRQGRNSYVALRSPELPLI